jgi:hypothetical protein
MPTDQGVWLHDHQSASSIEHTSPQHQTPASRVRQHLVSPFVFLVESQLLSQKQVLGYQRRSRPEYGRQEGDEVGNQNPSKSSESISPPRRRGILSDVSLNQERKRRFRTITQDHQKPCDF